MMLNSSELRAAGFKLKEVLPPALEAAARGDLRTRGVGLRSLEDMGPKRFVLSVDVTTLKYSTFPFVKKRKSGGGV
jgi:hypothetical protein